MLCSISVLLALISIFLTKITHDPCFISSKPTSNKKRTRLKKFICLYYLLAYKFIKIFFYHSKFCLVLPILHWLLPKDHTSYQHFFYCELTLMIHQGQTIKFVSREFAQKPFDMGTVVEAVRGQKLSPEGRKCMKEWSFWNKAFCKRC